MNTEKLLALIIEKEGIEPQIRQAQEECAELISALSHFCRNRKGALDEVNEEIADVEILLVQLKRIFRNGDKVRQWKSRKLHKLACRLGVTYDGESFV
ncbi:hypothetical protein [Seleniivibrio woodruffii]|uniref:hypothetical protein n=1 Tax=Seleniivibrio woodruffii TaxID=1078050 RepID=UPI002409ED98|nr:hypothetical protein [Seleniivibrio woodruffii]